MKSVDYSMELISELSRGRYALVAGPELNEQLGAPAWADVIATVATRFEDKLGGAGVPSLIRSKKFDVLSELIVHRIGAQTFANETKNIYESSPPPAIYRQNLLSDINDIPFRFIVNTGWGLDLEQLDASMITKSILPSQLHTIGKLIRDEEKFIVYPFGRIDNARSQVLSVRYLNKLIEQNPGAKEAVVGMIESCRLLFVGVTENYLEKLLDSIGWPQQPSRRHLAFVPKRKGQRINQELFNIRYGLDLIGYHDFEDISRLLGQAASESSARQNPAGLTPRFLPSSENLRVERLELQNIGPFEELNIEFNSNWNVILGDNGAGKTCILRALALCLMGSDGSSSTGAQTLLRSGCQRGRVSAFVSGQRYDTHLNRIEGKVHVKSPKPTPLESRRWMVLGFPSVRGIGTFRPSGPRKNSALGPGVDDLIALVQDEPDYRLSQVHQWIINLLAAQGKAGIELSSGHSKREIAEEFFSLIDEALVDQEISLKGLDSENWIVQLNTPSGEINFSMLSQGITSVMAWLGTTLKRIYEVYSEHNAQSIRGSVEQSGCPLILIDEIDAHLHPLWQNMLVEIVEKILPNAQIITTSHSPLLVNNLKPEEVYVAYKDHTNRPQVYRNDLEFGGMRSDQLLTSSLFGLHTTRSLRLTDEIDRFSQLSQNGEESTDEWRKLRSELASVLSRRESNDEGLVGSLLDVVEKYSKRGLYQGIASLSESDRLSLIEEFTAITKESTGVRNDGK